VTTLYRAFTVGKPDPLPPPTIQYADVALWQRQWARQEMQQQLDYWREQLRGAHSLSIPTDYPRPPVQSWRGASLPVQFPGELSGSLHALCRQEGVTLFMLLLAAFQTLLYRWSGESDVLVGTDVANRNRVETEGVIGFFINLLALRTDLRGAPLFRQVLQRVRKMVLGAYSHQDVPFEKVVEELRVPRQGNRTPLVRVLFVLQNVPQAAVQLPQLDITPVNTGGVAAAKFDLAVFLQEGTQGLKGSVVYSTDLLQEQSVKKLVEGFEVLLGHIVAQPDTSIDMLDILTEAEKVELANARQAIRESNTRNRKAVKGREVDIG